MNEVKIIPYMEIKDSRVDKGMRFTELRDASDPVEAAQTYCLERVDELVFLDIFATVEDGKTRIECMRCGYCSLYRLAVDIPITVSGGAGRFEHLYEAVVVGKAQQLCVHRFSILVRYLYLRQRNTWRIEG